MKFGAVPLAEAAGAILAHSQVVAGKAWKKGRRLSDEDISLLGAARRETVIVARPETGDIGEDEAARRLAEALCGAGAVLTEAFTGRANLYARSAGLARIDVDRINAVNRIDEAITVATLPVDEMVEPRQMLATVKIMPFAVPRDLIERAVAALGNAPAVAVAPFAPLSAALIVTTTPTTKDSVIQKAMAATAARVAGLGGRIVLHLTVPHEAGALTEALARAGAAGPDLILVMGANAVIDRRDHIPAAIEAAGGRVERFGMPVDPGNLLLTGTLFGRPVIGVPGCARSLKLNGFDLVLRRLFAGLATDRDTIATMGVGGLLKEIEMRPQPRDGEGCPAAQPARAPRLAALVLAAGRSTRMAGPNKLLLPLAGKPLVRHAVEAAVAADLGPVVVVTGHEGEAVRAALAGCPVEFRDNPDYAEGLSASLRVGVGALDDTVDGAFVLLGDMPRITAAHLRRLAAAFAPGEGREIAVPTVRGRWGNPLLWARRFFPAMAALDGDRGARLLAAAQADSIVEIEMADDGVLTDIDTGAAYAEAGGT
ncbi:NTP transferase domain-containing protein [Zavarzinia compransoris]|uniref:4-diphosphocytidyl-2C-methyl-D-erythritol kinase n=1 Tax=Zavarzinia compransoris TaxID=1264899 RepID=A0A317E346_9PROT|nr:molybdopterin-binding/glycosyltransferase family 2 protein [Zavarzinia compransoris]PWR21012.1 4-diphosphocytidyl-2C-methyl-D-erythritol kinase [Zavarzinia compransoris]TDP44044.1 molybdopterin molybdochelatase /molybdenum cofactor cytidylyltransferase [Zavarzinia compransoris]